MVIDQKLKSEIDNMLMNYEKKYFKIARDLALGITKKFPNDTLAWKILGATCSQIGQLKNSLRANQKVVELLHMMQKLIVIWVLLLKCLKDLMKR